MTLYFFHPFILHYYRMFSKPFKCTLYLFNTSRGVFIWKINYCLSLSPKIWEHVLSPPPYKSWTYAIWKSSLIILIPKPGKDTSQGTSYRPISLICPAAKVWESLFLPSINKYLIHAQDQHGFRREPSTTSALLQLTTDVAVGFNQRKPPDRTVCVAADLSAAFDTVCHNNLLSKINRSQLPPATARWLSC